DRERRESDIRHNLDKLMHEFMQNLRSALPPILVDVLQDCFLPHAERATAEEVRRRFQSALRELEDDVEGTKRWAWQHADSIEQLYRQGQTRGMAATDRDLTSEARHLITAMIRYIPARSAQALQEMIN